MCRYCAAGSPRAPTDRARILDLLALIERPDVLPAETALRIAGDLLAWADQSGSRLRCNAVPSAKPPMATVT